LKILYCNSIESNTGWGEEFFRAPALNLLDVETFNIDYRKNRYNLSKKIIENRDFDLFFLQKGDYFPLEIVKSIQRPKILYYTDLVQRFSSSDHLFKSKLFDLYLVRGESCRKIIIKRGWTEKQKVKIHLSGFEPQVYRNLNYKKEIDVLFVGTLTDRRRKILSEIHDHFKVKVVTVFGHEACRYYNRARIIVNIHAEEFIDTEIRVYEVLGSGGFLITEKLGDENPFTDNELVQSYSTEDMINKIGKYLKSSKERKEISSNGYRAAHNNHTYHHRAIELKQIFYDYCKEPLESAINYNRLLLYSLIEPPLRLKNFLKLRTRLNRYLKS